MVIAYDRIEYVTNDALILASYNCVRKTIAFFDDHVSYFISLTFHLKFISSSYISLTFRGSSSI